ncbi:MAG: shikimate kinase [Rickettsiales bacterium]|nr:shikimate kinase [Pseudomonadota bacterium]MDA0966398.1 shikimate kinase [Pseudomonadota bacterium]MDG4543260.1 shikimate kinase [Rickettsiales bacterium]MDG4545526.1 shikimate kinase [Rickettsiales bacterium]MDG4547975.1 shikimate kinase [Rickettsiales bacterium]
MLDLKRSVVLVGMMGCGKTAIGSRLAIAAEMPFVDLDNLIEENEKMSVNEIFERYGEDYFRKKERQAIEDVLNSKLCILATGGGAFMNYNTRQLIKKLGISVYIRADYDVLLERVARKNTRPLLENGDKGKILQELMDKRCPIYEEADITVDSSDSVHEDVVNKIIEGLSGRLEKAEC